MYKRWPGHGYASIIIMLSFLPALEFKCAGLDYPFDILPPGDHAIEHGKSLELYCQLDLRYNKTPVSTTDEFRFFSHDADLWKSSETFSVVNETTIKMTLNKPPPGSNYYYCQLGKVMCLTNVQVGYKPRPPVEFKCVSKNWESLKCSWKSPGNPIKTSYALTLAWIENNQTYTEECPVGKDRGNECTFASRTSYCYKCEYLIFNITGKNALGSNYTIRRFNHFASVIPNAPVNLTLINKTLTSAEVSWEVPEALHHFPPGLKFMIEYRSQWDSFNVWNKVEPKDSGNYPILIRRSHSFNLTGLVDAFANYTVKVYLKSYAGSSGPEFWSQPATLVFRTPSQRPSQPPETTYGSFDIVSQGNQMVVYVYWSGINERYQNGPHFGYEVICIGKNNVSCGEPLESTLTYAKFYYIKSTEYRFVIKSFNEIDRSLDSSYLYVPKFDSVPEPKDFTIVSYDKGIFELSWKPVPVKNLSNYTVFWCEDEKDSPVPCTGIMNWIHVPKNVTSRNVTVVDLRKFSKFAVAANLIDGTSSGMLWSSCVIFNDKALRKVDELHVVNVTSRTAEVIWEVRCAQISIIRGFAVYYCQEDKTNQSNSCEGNPNEHQIKLIDDEVRFTVLTRLKPYTTYWLQVSILTAFGNDKYHEGPRSGKKVFTTLEDVPSQPRNLKADEITNTSAILSWSRPLETNGILRSYLICNNYTRFDTVQNETEASIKTQLIRNLKSHATYHFTVIACTQESKCSGHSPPVTLTTDPGVPGKMSRARLSANDSWATITWKPPENPAGVINYYEVSVRFSKDEKTDSSYRFSRGDRGEIPLPACTGEREVKIKIRAVNSNKNNEELTGPWSEETTKVFQCSQSGSYSHLEVFGWVMGSCVAVAVIVLACVVRRLVKRYKDANVEIKLPPGLLSAGAENREDVDLENRTQSDNTLALTDVETALKSQSQALLDKTTDEFHG